MKPLLRYFPVALAGALLLLLSLSCAAPPVAVWNWYEVRTEHFRIVSRLDEERSVELARKLEMFHAVVETTSNLGEIRGAVPNLIYVFDDDATYERLGLSRNTPGVLFPHLRANYIVMYEEHYDATSILFHEYVHYLLHSADAAIYPMWFDEGFAEFLGTVRVEGGKVRIGLVPLDRVRDLQGEWLPLRRMLTTRSLADLSFEEALRFYAQSWALVHFLQVGRDPDAFAPGMTRYLRGIEAGLSPEEAIEDGFGVSFLALERELRAYIRRWEMQFLAIPAEQFAPSREAVVASLSGSQAATELGWLSLDVGANDLAERFFESALRDAHIDPAPAPRARAGLGVVAMKRKQWQEAGEFLRAALAAEPSNAEFLSEYGELLRQRALADESPVRRAELLRAARSHFSKSFQRAPEEPLNLVRYARTFLAEGEQASRAEDVLVEANRLLPSSLEIHSDLAAMYLASERRGDARRHLTIVAARTRDRDVAREATDALRQISPDTLAERRGPDHPINEGLDNFALLKDERAMAAATDDRITWAWATAGPSSAREEAIQAALERCNEVRVESKLIESRCRVYAVGNDIVWQDDGLENEANDAAGSEEAVAP